MRKILLGALLPLFMLGSCSNNDEREQEQRSTETGSLRLQTKVITDGIQVIPTRVTDYVDPFDLSLYMRNVESNVPFISWRRLSEFPNMYIDNIPAGDYEIILLSHSHDYVPEFDAPFYEGRTYLHVSANTHQDVKIDCIQANAGIRFFYDKSLDAAGLWNLFPVVRQFDGFQLEYAGDNKYRTGYFSQGDVAISFTGNDGALYLIGDEKEKVLNLNSEQLWEITLKAEINSIMMYVSIMTVDKPTHYEEFTVSRYN